MLLLLKTFNFELFLCSHCFMSVFLIIFSSDQNESKAALLFCVILAIILYIGIFNESTVLYKYLFGKTKFLSFIFN